MATVHQSSERITPGCLSGCRTITQMSALHRFRTGFRTCRQLAVNILFHHQRTDWYTERCTKTAILHIDCNGNLRVVHRCEAHESRVVAPTVLCRSCLSAHQIVATIGTVARSAGHGSPHTLHHLLVGCTIGFRVALGRIEGIQWLSFDTFHHMGSDEITAVGYRCA